MNAEIRSCPHCGAQLPEVASFCPHCAQDIKQRREVSPPRHMPGRLDHSSLMDAFGAVGAESGLIRELCPAVGTEFPIVHHDHSSSIRRSTSRYRLAGFTRVQCSMIRPIRPSASRLEGCWPVSITFISTPRE